jgi:Ni/Co efflux regulator RcnB
MSTMTHRKLVAALAALSLGLGNVAFADDHDHGRGDDHRGNADHRDNNRGPDRQMAQHDSRGAGPDHSFYRGGRLPTQYRSRQYVVDDWRGHHLSAPPRGYHWVQTGGDYVLAAIATGVIASVLLNQ